MTASSKTVCLRAFNEDLGGTNPWERQGPTPPPLPKRIAWPGGKIVSNKDEALASFLRRKLDQGQVLTPEQVAMLEKMVDPNASAAAAAVTAPAATAGGKRKVRSFGNGFGGVSASHADARGLLHKLERKVARAPDPFELANGGDGSSSTTANGGRRGRGRLQGRAMPSNRGSRNVLDLSSLKRGGTKAGAGKSGGGGGRRIVTDGQGGFTIATTSTPPRVYDEDFDDFVAGPAIVVSRKPRETGSKRLRGFGGAMSDVAASSRGGVVESAASAAEAAVAATIPAVYLEAGLSSIPKKNVKAGGAQGGTKGKIAAGQQRQKGRGQGAGTAKALPKGDGSGGAGAGMRGVNRSLEELMSGGLAACRR